MPARKGVITLEQVWDRYNINRRKFYNEVLGYAGTDNGSYLFRRETEQGNALSGLVAVPCRVLNACLKGKSLEKPIKMREIVKNFDDVVRASQLRPAVSYSKFGLMALHDVPSEYKTNMTVTLNHIGSQESEGQKYHIFEFSNRKPDKRLLVSAELARGMYVSDGMPVYLSQLLRKYRKEPEAEDSRTAEILRSIKKNPLQNGKTGEQEPDDKQKAGTRPMPSDSGTGKEEGYVFRRGRLCYKGPPPFIYPKKGKIAPITSP